jgi:hypothetical protein
MLRYDDDKEVIEDPFLQCCGDFIALDIFCLLETLVSDENHLYFVTKHTQRHFGETI